MGVRGLQTYIDRHCPDVKQRVCIFDVAEQHRQNFKVTPKLVIDGMSIIRSLYAENGNLEWIFGGQWIEYSQVLRDFTKKFKDREIKLVFFFDGCVVTEKRATWVDRRIRKYGEIAIIFDCLRSNKPFPKEVEGFILPTSMGHLTSMAIKVLCPEVEVYLTINDADIEIANYACKNKDVFGILSSDTDFIIFDSKPYLAIRNLDYSTMCTVFYDRNRLSEHLSLSLQLFPLFACLVGNDFMPYETLKRFHERIHAYGPSLPYTISSFIVRQGWRGQYMNENELRSVSYEICGNHSLLYTLVSGISMYITFHLPEVVSCIIGSRCVKAINHPAVFKVYKHQIYESSEVFEDYLDDLPPANLVYRPLRKRIYGIIFSNREHKRSSNNKVVIEEWCAHHGNKMESPEHIYPTYCPQLKNVFSLEDLWHQNISVKLKYFVACLKTRLSESEIQKIEPKFIVLCCVINYLLTYSKKPLLEKFEVAAFVAQAVYIQTKTPKEIHNIQGPYPETRTVHLCSLFMRGVTSIIFALGVCGNPISQENVMPWNYFDGKIFHNMLALTKKATPVKDILEFKESSVNLYEKLYNMATFDVKNF